MQPANVPPSQANRSHHRLTFRHLRWLLVLFWYWKSPGQAQKTNRSVLISSLLRSSQLLASGSAEWRAGAPTAGRRANCSFKRQVGSGGFLSAFVTFDFNRYKYGTVNWNFNGIQYAHDRIQKCLQTLSSLGTKLFCFKPFKHVQKPSAQDGFSKLLHCYLPLEQFIVPFLKIFVFTFLFTYFFQYILQYVASNVHASAYC